MQPYQKILPNIYHDRSSTFRVRIRFQNVEHQRSFENLDDAITFRDSIKYQQQTNDEQMTTLTKTMFGKTIVYEVDPSAPDMIQKITSIDGIPCKITNYQILAMKRYAWYNKRTSQWITEIDGKTRRFSNPNNAMKEIINRL